MLRYKFTIPNYDWDVEVYYRLNNLDINEVRNSLCSLACKGNELDEAITTLNDNEFNSGFTYSNLRTRSSVIVIAKTTTPSEFISTFVHEIYHLTTHICEIDNIDFCSEEAAYLIGHISQIMYIYSKPLMCNHYGSKRYITKRIRGLSVNSTD